MPIGAFKTTLLGAAGSAGAAPSMEIIAKHSFNGSAYDFTFTNIPQDYADLRLIMRSTRQPSTQFRGQIQVNGTTADYNDRHSYMYGIYGNISTGQVNGRNSWWSPHELQVGGLPAYAIVDFVDYSSSYYPIQFSSWGQNGYGSNSMVGFSNGLATNAGLNPLTSIRYGNLNAQGAMPSGTTLSLYGLGEAA
tara:strand:+ start:432 stop:1007 length:576 start_codon:yes stop_codon:yes gene_type:complete